MRTMRGTVLHQLFHRFAGRQTAKALLSGSARPACSLIAVDATCWVTRCLGAASPTTNYSAHLYGELDRGAVTAHPRLRARSDGYH